MRTTIRFGVIVAVACFGSSAVMAAPRLIDDFERGRISDPSSPVGTLVDSVLDNGTVIASQQGLPAAHSAFANRFETVNLLSGASASFALSPDAADVVDDAIGLRLPANASANFGLPYDAGAVDFLAGGNDRFAFDVGGDAGSGTVQLGFGRTIDGAFRTVELQTLTLSGPGTYSFDLSAFVGRDPAYPASTILRRVEGFELYLPGLAAGGTTRAMTLDNLRLIPEPASLLIAAAVPACAACRRRRGR